MVLSRYDIAERSSKVDRHTKYGAHTRFFAAASATVQVLANLSKPGVNRLISTSETRYFMSQLSADLENYNNRIAAGIDRGLLRGPGLDRKIVHLEQNRVQAKLDVLRHSDPETYASVIVNLNALLNPGPGEQFMGSGSASDRAYIGILDSVRQQLGRDIDFGIQSDREAVGNAVIDHIRRTGGCQVTGSRLNTC